jgi:hypothetical protein
MTDPPRRLALPRRHLTEFGVPLRKFVQSHERACHFARATRCRIAAIYRRGTNKERVDGEFLLRTPPFSAMSRIAVEPDLSGPKRRAMRLLDYDSSTKGSPGGVAAVAGTPASRMRYASCCANRRNPSMPIRNRCLVVATVLCCGCAAPPTGPVSAPAPAPAGSVAAAPAAPDPARVYADFIGRSEDLPRVARSPKEYDGRSVVLYGLRGGDLRPIDGRFSMPLAASDGRPAIPAVERPPSNQLYLLVPDDFAREARERRMLPGARGPVFVECRVSAHTAGKITSYPCEVVSLVLIADNRVTDSLWRARDGRALEYHRY